MMSWNLTLKTAAVAIVGMFVAASVHSASANAGQNEIAIGTGGVTGIYYPAGGAICEMVNKTSRSDGPRCFTESTPGSIYNLRALRNGEIGFAIVQSDWVYNAYHGNSVFQADGPFENLRTVFLLHSEPFTLVARTGSGITRFADLKGKRVNIGPSGSGQRSTMDVVMAAFGMSYDDMAAASELTETQMAKAICDGQIDAMIYTVGHPAAAIGDVANNCDVDLIDVQGPEIDKLIAENGFYQKVTIPGGLYNGISGAVETFGVRAVFVTTAEQDNNIVKGIVEDVVGDLDDFTRLHDSFAELTPSSMMNKGLAPMHDGALAAFKELGATNAYQ